MSKGTRRRGRAAALKLLFQLDTWGEFAPSAEQIGEAFTLSGLEMGVEERRFGERLCMAACQELERIDELLGKASRNWRVARMARVDRCILRLACGELLSGDTPEAVIIHEAVELAKEYGTTESGGFVHGVLAQVSRSM